MSREMLEAITSWAESLGALLAYWQHGKHSLDDEADALSGDLNRPFIRMARNCYFGDKALVLPCRLP